MKKIFTIAACVFVAGIVAAQTTENYLSRYNSLVARVGFSGVGVETLIDRWEFADPEDINHMVARFNFYLDKSMRDSVVTSYKLRYLGMDPLLELKDSTGRKMYYYNEKVFDGRNFAKAIEYLDKAISANNTRLDLYLDKAEALMTYEKTLPDSSRDCLLSLVDLNYTKKSKWDFPGAAVDEDFFLNEIQRLILVYYHTGSEQSLEAFRQVTERVLKHSPKKVTFLDNMGAYYVSAQKNDKKALKYYKAAQKIAPDDAISKQNISIIERRAAAAKKKK